jgi:hypothetical protein
MWSSAESRREQAPTIREMSSLIAQRDFAKRFEQGKLSFSGERLNASHRNRIGEQRTRLDVAGDFRRRLLAKVC